ncbi:MAG: haloalkane dehalogenase [Saprospiraceae bacterium]|nr:haloalkane dehalogenase [Saprospiraceae bacterium]
MEFVRTPDERFENLPDYPFTAKYLQLKDGMRMHFLDEGPSSGPVILLLHGEPSWSFLYRKMIPPLVEAGFRAVAPDLIGFGKSDKPTQTSDYSYEKHLNWLEQCLNHLDLKDIHLFCQDWGGLLGLRLATAQPERFSTITTANTFLPTASAKPNKAFLQWRSFSQTIPEFPVGKVLQMATSTDLSPEVMAAYEAPFPDESYKAGARIFPALVPIEADDPEAQNNKAAWKVLQQWEKPFLTLFSDSDPIMKGLEKYFIEQIPGAKGQAHKIIEGAAHFLQEDKGSDLAKHLIEFINRSI